MIANACFLPRWSGLNPFSVLGQKPHDLTDELLHSFRTNVVGNIHLFNIFLPLILEGDVKKIITISSGMADLDLVVKYRVDGAGPYAASKAAMNMVAAKFHAEYEKQGVMFLSISPGVVDTGSIQDSESDILYTSWRYTDSMVVTEEEIQKVMAQGAKFTEYAPHFQGPVQPEESVNDVLKVIEKASLVDGYGGAFISHLGNKQWL